MPAVDEERHQIARRLAAIPGLELEPIAVSGAGLDPEIDRAVAAQEGRPFEPPAGDVEDDLAATGEGEPLGGDDQTGGEDVLIRPDQDLPFPFDAFALELAPGLAARSSRVGDGSLIVRRRRHRESLKAGNAAPCAGHAAAVTWLRRGDAGAASEGWTQSVRTL